MSNTPLRPEVPEELERLVQLLMRSHREYTTDADEARRELGVVLLHVQRLYRALSALYAEGAGYSAMGGPGSGGEVAFEVAADASKSAAVAPMARAARVAIEALSRPLTAALTLARGHGLGPALREVESIESVAAKASTPRRRTSSPAPPEKGAIGTRLDRSGTPQSSMISRKNSGIPGSMLHGGSKGPSSRSSSAASGPAAAVSGTSRSVDRSTKRPTVAPLDEGTRNSALDGKPTAAPRVSPAPAASRLRGDGDTPKKSLTGATRPESIPSDSQRPRTLSVDAVVTPNRNDSEEEGMEEGTTFVLRTPPDKTFPTASTPLQDVSAIGASPSPQPTGVSMVPPAASDEDLRLFAATDGHDDFATFAAGSAAEEFDVGFLEDASPRRQYARTPQADLGATDRSLGGRDPAAGSTTTAYEPTRPRLVSTGASRGKAAEQARSVSAPDKASTTPSATASPMGKDKAGPTHHGYRPGRHPKPPSTVQQLLGSRSPAALEEGQQGAAAAASSTTRSLPLADDGAPKASGGSSPRREEVVEPPTVYFGGCQLASKGPLQVQTVRHNIAVPRRQRRRGSPAPPSPTAEGCVRYSSEPDGLRAGDVVVALDGRTVSSLADLLDVASAYRRASPTGSNTALTDQEEEGDETASDDDVACRRTAIAVDVRRAEQPATAPPHRVLLRLDALVGLAGADHSLPGSRGASPSAAGLVSPSPLAERTTTAQLSHLAPYVGLATEDVVASLFLPPPE